MARYQHDFDPDTSYGSALRLVEASPRTSGVVLDVGCGYGALADPLREAGFTYVGVDLEPSGLADLEGRGHEVHRLSLLQSESQLADGLLAVVGDRPLAFVLALDVLEHLLDVPATLRTLAAVAARDGAELVVSYPNVTHFDLAAKLLIGRWDTTDEGLLDRTHTQFLAGDDLPIVFAAAGWHQVAADDVIRTVSDQCFPSYAPVLRMGSPARELLWSWRQGADTFGDTFQFVRRFEPGEPAVGLVTRAEAIADEARPFATVVAVSDGHPDHAAADDALLADVHAQMVTDIELLTVQASSLEDEVAGINDALRRAAGRYVFVVRSGDRMAPSFLAACAEVEAKAPGVVLRAKVQSESGSSVDTAALDVLHVVAPLPVVSGAVGLPSQAVQSMGLALDHRDGDASFAVVASRAALWCGVQPVDRAVLTAADSSVPDADLVAVKVTEALDRDPILLRAGDASRLAGLRERVGSSDEGVVAMQAEAAARAEQIEVLSAHIHELGAREALLVRERDHWRTVAERKFTVQVRALLSKVLRRLESG